MFCPLTLNKDRMFKLSLFSWHLLRLPEINQGFTLSSRCTSCPQVSKAVRPEVQQRRPYSLHQAVVWVGHDAKPGASHDAELRQAAYSASQVSVTCKHNTWTPHLHNNKGSQLRCCRHLIRMPPRWLCGSPSTPRTCWRDLHIPSALGMPQNPLGVTAGRDWG